MRIPSPPFLPKGAFAQGVLAIGGGTALAQAAAVFLSPVLTRLYRPEDMGMWGLFLSYVGFASVLSTLRYEVAIVAAKDDKEALSLTYGSLLLVLFTSFLGMLAFEVLRRKGFLGFDKFPVGASVLVFLTLIFTGLALVLRYFALRKENFSAIGRFTVVQGWAKVLLQIVLAPFGALGLLLGETFGRLIGLKSLWSIVPRGIGRLDLPLMVRYWMYPMVQLPSSVLNTLALMALVPVFVVLYGPAVGGALALAQRVVGFPLSLIGGAVADVFYGRAAFLVHNEPGQLVSFFLRIFLKLALTGLLLGAAMWFLAPRLVPWLFGPEWTLAGNMMGVMGPWMAAQFAVGPVSRLVFLSSQAWLKMVYDILSLLVILSPLWLWRYNGPEDVLLNISLSKVGVYGVYFVVLLWLAFRMKREEPVQP